MDNRTIAQRLLEYARDLEAVEVNPYRVQAYRKAADTVLALERPVADIVRELGRDGLEVLPGIGSHLSYTLEALVRTGEFRTLGGDAGHIDPEHVLLSVPGVGPRLARRLRDELNVATLEGLEMAAHDGRLASLGVGPKRLRGIQDSLAARLSRTRLPEPVDGEPPVAELLAIDADYRARAEQDLLPTTAPRRFNPGFEPWRPFYQVDRGGWRYRVHFSNTALAHRLNRTQDWVNVGFDDGFATGQRTVVTETRGDLRGRRVVRGRENECRRHYEALREAEQAAAAGVPALPAALPAALPGAVATVEDAPLVLVESAPCPGHEQGDLFASQAAPTVPMLPALHVEVPVTEAGPEPAILLLDPPVERGQPRPQSA